MIVDTHAHVVSADEERYPRQVTWLEVFRSLWEKPVTAELMATEMDEARIDRSLLVQPYSIYGFDSSYVVDSAARYPKRFASVCSVDMVKPEAPQDLARWVERGARGLRIFANFPVVAEWLDDPKTFGVWQRAEDRGIPVCVQMVQDQIPQLRRVLGRFRKVQVVINHLGGAKFDEGPPYPGLAPLFDLAQFPNLLLKFSTPSLNAAGKGRSTPREAFSTLVECFGARKLMWGSNFPQTFDPPLKEQVELAKRRLAFLSKDDQRWLLGETALTLWPELR